MTEKTQKKKKTDRRTLYTEGVIKDSFLKMLTRKSYSDVTVADICREADIHRGTFYLHYKNVAEVMEATLREAMESTRSMLSQVGCPGMEEGACGDSLCSFIRNNRKYQPLFFEDALRSVVLEKLGEQDKERYKEKMMESTGLSSAAIDALFYFKLNGCLAIVRQNIERSDKEWAEIQCGVDSFLKRGFKVEE